MFPSSAAETPENDEDDDDATLFAASGRDRQISLWSAKSGRLVANLRLMHNPQKKAAGAADKNFQFWLSALWTAPDTLLTGGPYAEMLR